MDTRTFTYQTRIEASPEVDAYLCACASLMSQVERKLYADICRGRNPNNQKQSYLIRYGITARQFNAINMYLKGKVASAFELIKIHLVELRFRINKTKKCIKSLGSKKSKTPHQKNKLHQKQRLLVTQLRKLDKLQADIQEKKTSICFGSKRLFRKQFSLKENGYESFVAWKKDWISSRSSQFSLIGSKDESGGNQSCIATIADDGRFTLKLRVPNALQPNHGKFVSIEDIHLSYGKEEVLSAIEENKERNFLSKKAQQSIHGDKFKILGQAISYRFKKDKKGWIVFFTIDRKAPKVITKKALGAIGVDINQHHLAVTEMDRGGNPVKSFSIPLSTYGKDSNQTKAIVGDACKTLIEYAIQKQKPLVIENLDFQKKKSQLADESPKFARMISSLAYNQIIQSIKSRAFRFGVQVFSVNPAYTSIIGRVKYAKRYGLSIHHAAALVIARRIMNFSERLPRSLENIPDGHGRYLTLGELVKIRARHVWHLWAKVLKRFKAAHAAQYQIARQRRQTLCLTSTESAILADEVPF